MPITPDSKDWTWVLERPCDECGFESDGFDRAQVGAMIRANAATWREQLAAGPAVRRRPSGDRWSTLEYGCHVRDVLRTMDGRLGLMLSEVDPVFANWDQDETAIADRYDEQDPVAVSGELESAAARLADHFDSVSADEWGRPGTRSNGSHFTVESLARYALHDLSHHVWDVTVASAG
jgi:hypothetical protein